jgi:hypothetical protein
MCIDVTPVHKAGDFRRSILEQPFLVASAALAAAPNSMGGGSDADRVRERRTRLLGGVVSHRTVAKLLSAALGGNASAPGRSLGPEIQVDRHQQLSYRSPGLASCCYGWASGSAEQLPVTTRFGWVGADSNLSIIAVGIIVMAGL